MKNLRTPPKEKTKQNGNLSGRTEKLRCSACLLLSLCCFGIVGCGWLFEKNLPYSTVHFALPYPAASSSDASVRGPNEIILINLAEESPGLEHRPIEAGENSIELPKEGLHLLGLVYNDSLSYLGTTKGISSAIELLGNIGVAAIGLDSLPLSGNAANEVDLGEVELEGSSYLSSIDTEVAANSLGYSIDTLLGFGVFDSSLKKALNPDINGDGVYDFEQYYYDWALRTVNTFRIDFADTDYEGNRLLLAPARLSENEYEYYIMFSLFDELHQFGAGEEIRMVFADDAVVRDVDGNQVTDVSQITGEGDGYDYLGMNVFVRLNGVSQYDESTFPYDGEYRIEIAGQTFTIRNVVFIKASDDYEGITLPVFRISTYDTGEISELAWRWITAENGAYRPADPDEVRLKIYDMYFALQTPGSPDESHTVLVRDLDVDYFNEGSVSYPQGINFLIDEYIGLDVQFFYRSDCWYTIYYLF